MSAKDLPEVHWTGNPPVAAEATASIANDLERALQGKATAFDFAGGRGEWKSKQKEASNA